MIPEIGQAERSADWVEQFAVFIPRPEIQFLPKLSGLDIQPSEETIIVFICRKTVRTTGDDIFHGGRLINRGVF